VLDGTVDEYLRERTQSPERHLLKVPHFDLYKRMPMNRMEVGLKAERKRTAQTCDDLGRSWVRLVLVWFACVSIMHTNEWLHAIVVDVLTGRVEAWWMVVVEAQLLRENRRHAQDVSCVSGASCTASLPVCLYLGI
jgi:hypothetical protein